MSPPIAKKSGSNREYTDYYNQYDEKEREKKVT